MNASATSFLVLYQGTTFSRAIPSKTVRALAPAIAHGPKSTFFRNVEALKGTAFRPSVITAKQLRL
jgi:hypothetical protein